MALQWASSMGEVHAFGSVSTQILRYFQSQTSMGTSIATGFLSNLAIREGTGSLRGALVPEQNTWICQGVFRNSFPLAGPFPQNSGLAFMRGGSEQLRMTMLPLGASGARPDGEQYVIQVKRGAVVLATSSEAFYAEEFVIFQFKATINTGVLGSFEVRAARVENQTIQAFSTIVTGVALNTADTGVAGADQLELDFQVETGVGQWDHVWLFDDTGAINNDFPGKFLLVQGVIPNANGVQEDWSYQGGQGSGFEVFNDPSNSIADDIGRATSNVIGDIVLMDFQNPGETGAPGFEGGPIIGSGSAVQGVIFHHVSGMEASGTRTVRPIYRNLADVRAEGADVVLNTIPFAGFFEVFELNPVSVLAWTAQQVKEMQWGLKVQA